MAKLHEALAVIQNLKGQMEKTRTDLTAAFTNKKHLFSEKLVTFKASEEGVPDTIEEQSSIQSTVLKELRWLTGIWSKPIDVGYQIAEANTKARGDIIIDGTTLVTGVPGTALMELEKRLTELHGVLAAVPTLDPAKNFQPDADRGDGVYRASEDRRPRTKKVQRPLILHAPTKEHPAQVTVISEDVVIGHLITQEWSSLITPADKARLLERCETLKRAVKEALSRANEQTTDKQAQIARTLFDYVLTP